MEENNHGTAVLLENLQENPTQDANDLMERVISNPLILQQILKHVNVDNASMKMLRLVSKKWNDLILTLPEPRIRLTVNHFRAQNSWDPQMFITFSETMEHKLARCIGMVSKVKLNAQPIPQSIIEGVPDYVNGYRLESVGYKNLKFCIERFSDDIQIIDLMEVYAKMDYVRVLHRLLQNHCPNLVRILLSVDSIAEAKDNRIRPRHVSHTWRGVDFTNLSTVDGGIISDKLKLKEITCVLFESVTPRVTCGPLHNLYQALINCAPNLVGLKQDMICFPNCSRLNKLKSLSFKIQLKDSDFHIQTGVLQVPFTLTGLTQMLTQISSTLEYLKIKIIHDNCTRPYKHDCDCREQLMFNMPQMYNLKVFKCSDFDLFFGNILGGNLASLRRVNSMGGFGGDSTDSLRCISIGRKPNGHTPGISSTITTLCTISHNQPIARNVDTVIINGIFILTPLINLDIPFPAISKLIINKHFQTQDDGDMFGAVVGGRQLTMALRICVALNLTSLTFDFPFPTTCSVFVNVLDNFIPMFIGGRLKQLMLRDTKQQMNVNGAINDDFTIQRLENVFMSMKDMDFVKIINASAMLSIDVVDRLCRFNEESGIPVSIKASEALPFD